MSPVEGQFFHGIYPSILCPFRPDLTIDTEALAAHAESLAAIPGIRGILCNGHAGESAVLSRGEKHRVVEVVRHAIGRNAVLVAGVGQEESGEAAAEAHDAVVAGADAVMVLAPFSWALGHDPEMVTRHHRMIAERADRSIMLFQGSVRSGRLSYPPETLRRLLQLPNVVAIKEGSWETAAYEATRRLVEAEAPHVAVMASGDEHLLSCYVLGSEGSLVSLAVLVPEAVVALDEAVRHSDLSAARAHHAVIYPLARAIYGGPAGHRAAARLKACLHLLDRLPNAIVRPPGAALTAAETAEMAALLARVPSIAA